MIFILLMLVFIVFAVFCFRLCFKFLEKDNDFYSRFYLTLSALSFILFISFLVNIPLVINSQMENREEFSNQREFVITNLEYNLNEYSILKAKEFNESLNAHNNYFWRFNVEYRDDLYIDIDYYL